MNGFGPGAALAMALEMDLEAEHDDNARRPGRKADLGLDYVDFRVPEGRVDEFNAALDNAHDIAGRARLERLVAEFGGYDVDARPLKNLAAKSVSANAVYVRAIVHEDPLDTLRKEGERLTLAYPIDRPFTLSSDDPADVALEEEIRALQARMLATEELDEHSERNEH